ncbi:hypothetical protein RRH01S_19_00130 [Rhizobium rhizogenes NBRC 13257]|uniref:Uncharacterized protein n=1 Tax=Rhizobium rhizogenes NBRC 13257 TaxID=1220581 RepID=A0AA87Q665_RHIRH|nr:hypothetical protein RRH01S_19_00130 [Rhizobium rhizogenes NBRC 13257]
MIIRRGTIASPNLFEDFVACHPMNSEDVLRYVRNRIIDNKFNNVIFFPALL